jgi:hypothetical protein
VPRFVILEHDHPELHWDLLLDDGEDRIPTWRLIQIPNHGSLIDAIELPKHRRMYLDYEGPVSGNQGSVLRWDAGEYQFQGQDQNQLQIHFDGILVRGNYRLTKSQYHSGLNEVRWIFGSVDLP